MRTCKMLRKTENITAFSCAAIFRYLSIRSYRMFVIVEQKYIKQSHLEGFNP